MKAQLASRPPEIDKIADRITVDAIIALIVGISFVLMGIVSWGNGNYWANSLAGIAITLIGCFILKTARDFRRVKPWTWPVMSFLVMSHWSLMEYLADPEIRRAFGQDEGPYQTRWPSDKNS